MDSITSNRYINKGVRKGMFLALFLFLTNSVHNPFLLDNQRRHVAGEWRHAPYLQVGIVIDV